ncbi:sigma-B regulation protein RsbU (phosphoserine phosphatase) [Methanofollis sp. W23]|uniref:PP2C family protein-serine/threonine phosphatase n=1 Tax=Methanofollis sp. W23 TaxID=2817849 RepID=UPI001AE732A6|nr:SpoIIE family protein phosphatase [Methanofollis sp. W23]MBP2145146.1 sigma-B regulation protein RsbU (phosphoserine phosphatase) [Methanofollis sp. W23]
MNPQVEDFIILFQMICVIIVAAYFITRTPTFTAALEHRLTPKGSVALVLFFGALSIYGTLSGVEVLGAPVNVRDLGPMVAGVFCGPLVGVGAGLIGGGFRLGMGGFTAVPCALSTVLAGLLGGVVYLLLRRADTPVPRVGAVVGFAVGMEALHMGLVLLACPPFEEAWALVRQVSVPMVLANAAGMFVFAFIIANLVAERRTQTERDAYQEELRVKKAELKVAAEIQQTFLPRSIPTMQGFDLAAVSCPAREVGGDFYDAIRLQEGKTGLVIADVSGKSVPAAIFMALSRTIIRAMALRHPDVSLALEDANAMLLEESDTGMFVTLFYGVLDEETRTLTYANAGHNSPLLLRRGTDEFVSLAPTGVALGAAEEMEYGAGEVRVEAGDLLVMFTDGVTEAFGPGGEGFGNRRLEETVRAARGLPAMGVIRAIREAVLGFTGEGPQDDDVTVMVLKGE